MATDIAFVGELGGKRSGAAGRTIRLIRLFEVSTRFLFMRRLIFPCVLDSRGCFAGHIRFGDVEFRLARSCVVPHEAFANSVSGQLGWSQQGSWLAVLIRPILSRLTSGWWLPCFQKAAGRIRFADVQAT